jgi:hypothetical protein
MGLSTDDPASIFDSGALAACEEAVQSQQGLTQSDSISACASTRAASPSRKAIAQERGPLPLSFVFPLDFLFYILHRIRQGSMATPGNFGGGSTGPDQIFLGIARAPPSAPGRGRAQSPVRRNPNPQTTEHEAHESGSQFEVLLFSSQSNRTVMPVSKALSEVSFTAPHLILGRSPPVGIVKGRSDGPKLGGPP